MFGGGESFGSAVTSRVGKFGGQRGFSGSIESCTEGWGEGFGDGAVGGLFIGSHS